MANLETSVVVDDSSDNLRNRIDYSSYLSRETVHFAKWNSLCPSGFYFHNISKFRHWKHLAVWITLDNITLLDHDNISNDVGFNSFWDLG